MVKQITIYCFLSIACQCFTTAQEINQIDSDGKRHGVWQKFYEGTTQLRYEGTFDHGKEVGTFSFYDKQGGHPTAIKLYTPDTDFLDVTFYTRAGKKISEGRMLARSKEGEWLYYHKDGTSIMTRETYKNNILEGDRTVFFENGDKAQSVTFVNGLEEGLSVHYNENGKIIKEFTYARGKLQGPTKLYDYDGILIREGNYKDNRKHGTWRYYKGGKLNKTLKFPQNKIGVQN